MRRIARGLGRLLWGAAARRGGDLDTATPVYILLDTILADIIRAEQKHGQGTGITKKETVMELIDASTPLLLRLAEATAGRGLQDKELLRRGISQVTDGTVDIMNAFRILPK